MAAKRRQKAAKRRQTVRDKRAIVTKQDGRRVALFLMGCVAIAGVGLYAYGGPSGLVTYAPDFAQNFAHKFTARSMLEGTFRLNRTLLGVIPDGQVFNGAAYTNWGYGVPLLQIPFQALSLILADGAFFPDRLIFFVYFLALIPLLWLTLHRALTDGSQQIAAWILSALAVLVALANPLLQLMAYHFAVYEETMAYFVVAQLCALCCYLRFQQGHKETWLVALGFSAALGLLIRSTGLPYLGLWAVLAFLAEPRRKTALIFAMAALPIVSVWVVGNIARSGSPFATGIGNSNPGMDVHYSVLRFGSQCSSTLRRFVRMSRLLFESFFFAIPDRSRLAPDCGFEFEGRGSSGGTMFPLGVLVFFCGALAFHVWRRDERPSIYLPFLLLVALFFAFAQGGLGFAWRYVGDFWPGLILIGVRLAQTVGIGRRAQLALAALFLADVCVVLAADVRPWLSRLEPIGLDKGSSIKRMREQLVTTPQPAVPSQLRCGDHLPPWLYADGRGWMGGCRVLSYTNLYLGVPDHSGPRYTLRMKTDVALAPTLRVYLNGRIFEARWHGDEYLADVTIDRSALYSPVVLITTEWAEWPAVPSAKLLEIELF